MRKWRRPGLLLMPPALAGEFFTAVAAWEAHTGAASQTDVQKGPLTRGDVSASEERF